MIINLGSNIFEDCDAVLVVNEVEVFRLRERDHDGRLICDFDIRDEDGSRLAKISKNNVVYAADNYQLQNLARESFIQRPTGEDLVRVQETDLDSIKITGEFWIDGYHVVATDDELILGPLRTRLRCVRITRAGKAIVLSPGSTRIGVR